jgi:hypothetical protein
MADLARRMWTRLAGWVEQNARHVTVEFVADSEQEPIPAYGGYLRLWLTEGFLAKRTTWGNTHFPALRPGHLAVVNIPRERLPGPLTIHNGRLHVDSGLHRTLLADADYLLLRVECRSERDDWRFPHLDELIRLAGSAYLEGHTDAYRARRTEAVSRAWNSTDLTPADRKRVAKLVQEEIDAVTQLGAVPGPRRTIAAVAPQRLLSTDAPELANLSRERRSLYLQQSSPSSHITTVRTAPRVQDEICQPPACPVSCWTDAVLVLLPNGCRSC